MSDSQCHDAPKQIGAFEIIGLLGRGGMGEVWRARDTKLGRDVAIKMLPEHLAHDKELVLRFEREAKLLASINHTNIAASQAEVENLDRPVRLNHDVSRLQITVDHTLIVCRFQRLGNLLVDFERLFNR